MKYRKGIFAVVYTISEGEVQYLILKRKHHWIGWEFVKGKIEKFETKKMASRREVEEETGLKILKLKKFNVKGDYKYQKILKDRPNIIGQTYHLFGVEVKKGKVKIDKIEHSGYKWVSFKEAMKKLTWPNQRACLKIVNNFLEKD
jgi:8-oxo-dGTP pyrophosphatase MutT (NUDIX family)